MKSFLVIFTFLFAIPVFAAEFQANHEIGELFDKVKVEGTLVVFNLQTSSYVAHNPDRAEKRYFPASTFKIPNSLIGLSVGAVRDVDEVLPYGGEPQPFKVWEKDMGLRDAIKISNIPIYQELARRIGTEKMRQNVRKLNYGNSQIGSVVDLFWLEGPLEISAVEQTGFLAKLARGKLSFPQIAQVSVREIVKLEEGRGWTLYGKTGWSKGIGWWVGWVEKNGNIYSFALNIDMPDLKDASKRVELGKGGLEILGIID